MSFADRRFLQLSLALPLVLPALALVLNGLNQSSLGGQVSVALVLSAALGGTPYAIFAAALLYWGRRRPISSLIRAAWMSPLLFAPFAAALVGTVTACFGPAGSRVEALLLYGVLSFVYGLVIGYAYVVLVMATRWCFVRLGLLEREYPRLPPIRGSQLQSVVR